MRKPLTTTSLCVLLIAGLVACSTPTATTRVPTEPPATRAVATATPNLPTLTWPFHPGAEHWAIINGYRGNLDHAPNGSPNNYALFALDFAHCADADVTAPANGLATCTLPAGWDTTIGEPVYAPMSGTVGWAQQSCRALAFDVDGHAGYRITLAHVDLLPGMDWGQLQREHVHFMQGQQIGTVSANGCIGTGNHIHMALYTCSDCASDPADQRVGQPFSGAWGIGGCSLRDDGQTMHAYTGLVVPCPSGVALLPTDLSSSSGIVLCKADWSQGLDGWTGSSDWTVSDGTLINDGTNGADLQTSPSLVAPCNLAKEPNYRLEATVQVTGQGFDPGFDFFVRYTPPDQGYILGVTDGYNAANPLSGVTCATAASFYQPLQTADFSPGTGPHTYVVIVSGNNIQLLIDNHLYLNVTDAQVASGSLIGLTDKDTQLVVSRLEVIRE